MDPTTSRVYLSRNVIFDENLFPAQAKATASLSLAQELSSSLGIVLLPSHFYSLNSMSTAHTQNTSITPISDAGTLPLDDACVTPRGNQFHLLP
jgi:hypothetical protein